MFLGVPEKSLKFIERLISAYFQDLAAFTRHSTWTIVPLLVLVEVRCQRAPWRHVTVFSARGVLFVFVGEGEEAAVAEFGPLSTLW